MKSIFEIVFILFFLWFSVFFIFYHLMIDDFCDDMSWKNRTDYLNSVTIIRDCNDSVLCYYTKWEVNENNEVVSWSCQKKTRKLLEWPYYREKVLHIIK